MTGKIRQSIGRQYAPAELAGLFFAFSAAGWLWEVALHLVFNGELVKRGTMLGPWLPIYGAGVTTSLPSAQAAEGLTVIDPAQVHLLLCSMAK